jgi:anti-sigma factor RsiW
MKNACKKWKDQLLEAALTGARSGDLEVHLRTCQACAAELQELEAVRAQQDSLLPLLVRGAEPSPRFRARVLAAAETSAERKGAPRWRVWTLIGAAAVAAVVFMLQRGTVRKEEAQELAAAQKLAEWRAPSDSLLKTPGQEILKETPRLGEPYLTVPMNKGEEE